MYVPIQTTNANKTCVNTRVGYCNVIKVFTYNIMWVGTYVSKPRTRSNKYRNMQIYLRNDILIIY